MKRRVLRALCCKVAFQACVALLVLLLSYQWTASSPGAIQAVALVLHAIGVVADPVVRVAMIMLRVIPRGELTVFRLFLCFI